MNSAICTLFEGHYHYGVAALSNSLFYQGFEGSIFAGYRGELPNWSKKAIGNSSLNWPGAQTLTIGENFKIHFLPLNTDYHLTNYKPDFMIKLWEGPAKGADLMLFFDPDIVVTSVWSFFEDWISGCGVALCEDINSPLGENHPRRITWRQYFGRLGINLKFKDATYANGGFLGVNYDNINFLLEWKKIQEAMAPAIGGLSRSTISGTPVLYDSKKPYAPFLKTDQDALNATVEAWNGTVSFIGHEGMDFRQGENIMPHAIGKPKPWQINPIIRILAGYAPRRVELEYWKHSNGVLTTQPRSRVFRKQFFMKIASFISRFYRRR